LIVEKKSKYFGILSVIELELRLAQNQFSLSLYGISFMLFFMFCTGAVAEKKAKTHQNKNI
jgi:hypothetical protein